MVLPMIIGLFGILSILLKRNLFGLIIGIHLLMLGAGASLILGQSKGELAPDQEIFSFFVIIMSVVVSLAAVVGSIRLFRARGDAKLEDIQSLKY